MITARVIIGECLILFLLGISTSAAAQPAADSCSVCHLAIGVDRLTRPAQLFKEDIHALKGFRCVACHGGDANDPGMSAMDPAKGYIGKPQLGQIVEVCGRCHSDARFMRQYNPSLRVDQVTEYYTSVHGRRLKEFVDPKVATCTSCHTPHQTRPPSDPRSSVHALNVADTCAVCHADTKHMAGYKIPTDQLDKYKKSVHWKMISVKGDLSAPTCNDCHGNHGAAPPGLSWVGNVCGQCHVVNTELFNKSRHSQVFVQMGIPGCASCHDNHAVLETSDAMLGLGEGALCARCHSPEDAGGKSAAEMRRLIDTLREKYEAAHQILLKAEHAGMEVSQAQFDLNEAKTLLIKSRATIHAFSVDEVKKDIEPALTVAEKAHARGVKALDDLQFRRKGLAVSVVIILAVVAGLVVKIKDMEKQK